MELGQVFTTKVIAKYMASLFSQRVKKVLEPCFGGGAFIDACLSLGFEDIVGCEIDPALFEEGKKKYPKLNLLKTDFLKYHPDCKFDGIIMNPPYVRQEKIDELQPFGITKKHLRADNLFKGLPSTANLYMYFVIKAISLLAETGELVVIFPSTWLDACSGKIFEKMILEKTSIEEKIYVSGPAFETEPLVEVIILKLKKCYEGRICATEKHLELVDGLLREQLVNDFSVHVELTVPFSEYADVRRGLSTGWNQMYINPEGIKNQSVLSDILSSPKNVTGFSTKKSTPDKLLMITAGTNLSADVAMYIEKNKAELLKGKKPKTLYEKACSEDEWYTLKPLDSNGIIFGYIVRNDMRFILNTNGIMARDNFYILKPKCDEYILLALLNNHYTFYQLECFGKKYGAGILKIQRYDIENLSFIDLKRVSSDDKGKLRLLGEQLVKTADSTLIEDITKIVSKYTDIPYSKIVDGYQKIKMKRLEG